MNSKRRFSFRTGVTAALALLAASVAVPLGDAGAGSDAAPPIDVGTSIGDQVEDLPDVPAPSLGDPLTSAELADLATVADARGITVDEAIASRGSSRDFSLLVGALEQRYPDDFAGARFDPDDGHEIAWRAQAPAAAADLVADFQTAVALRTNVQQPVNVVEDRGFSQLALHADVADVHMKLWNDGAVRELTTEADPETGEIVAVVRPHDARSANAAIVTSLRQRHALDSKVTLRITRTSLSSDHGTQYGGEVMSTCTSGFTVDHPSNPDGISTAGHCGNSQSMDGDSLNLVTEYEGTYGDMQIHHNIGGSTFPDDFYSGSSTVLETNRRDVSSVGAPAVGLDVCRNGKTTHKHCDEIKALGHCVSGSCNLVRVYNDTASGGDSGGPVFWGNTAYGLHMGNNWHDWKRRDVFTRADYLPWGVGYTVRS